MLLIEYLFLLLYQMIQCLTCAGCNEEHMTCGTEPWAVEGAFWVADLDAITWKERREEGEERKGGVNTNAFLLIRTNL